MRLAPLATLVVLSIASACTQDFDALFGDDAAVSTGGTSGSATGGIGGSSGTGGAGAGAGVGGTAGMGGLGGAGAGGVAGNAGSDASTSAYAEEVKKDGPLAYWRLGEVPAASVAKDEQGQHDGQYLAKALQAVFLGQPGAIANDANTAAGFDGTHWLRVPNAPELSFVGSASFTVECWAQWKDLDQSDAGTAVNKHILVSKFDSSTDAGYQLYFFSSTNTLAFARIDGPLSGDRDVASMTLTPDGKFHHVVGVFDATLSPPKVQLWVNGILRETDNGDEVIDATTEPLVIGNADNASQWLQGVVDEVAIYAKPLAADRIAEHHKIGAGAPDGGR